MTQKEKILRKQRIKEILLKTLHIICYILSLLFILVCIVGGVKSCEKTPQSVSAENESSYILNKRGLINIPSDDYKVYTTRYYGDGNYDTTWTISYFDIPQGQSATQQSSIYKVVYFPDNSYFYYNGDRHDIEYLAYRFDSLLWGPQYTSTYVYQLYRMYFADSEGNTYFYYYRTSSYVNDSSGNLDLRGNISNVQICLLSEVTDQQSFLHWFSLADTLNFIFNKQFNYNAPLNTNVQGLYGSMSFDSSGPNIRWKNYDVGYFLSNGQLFNQIQYTCIQSDSNHILFSDGQVDLAPSGYWIYGWISYINTITNHVEVVNRHDQVPFTHNGSTTTYYANSSTWINDQYRYITFLAPLTDSLSITINSFNNNNQNYYSGAIYSDGGDVFTLLSYGFSSLSDFWSLNILPGISLGVLFFLPAVVGVIITIVHLLRK